MACIGSAGANNRSIVGANASKSVASAGNDLCGEGYEGPLCGLCSENYYKYTISNECHLCSGDGVSLSPLSIALIVIVVVVLVAAILVACLQPAPLMTWLDRNRERFNLKVRQATILYITWVILSALQDAHEFKGGSSVGHALV